MPSALVGIDTGGTFTDFVFVSECGELEVRKAASTPDDPSRSIIEALREYKKVNGLRIIHGTTVATNAMLERRGAKTALLTTHGCRDVLEIGRQTREKLYDLSPKPRIPLIPRNLRFGIVERLDWLGETVQSLDVSSVEEALDSIQAAGVSSVAICFLFSFLSPAHEIEAGKRARERGLSVSLSSDIAPEFREYERTSTVCANAYVAPVMESYISRLKQGLSGLGAGRLSIMQSNGGTLRAEEASSNAIKTALSGPAGGVIAASKIARDAGVSKIIAFDMGGTSTDVALVDGEPVTIRSGEIAGLSLLTPMLDIHTVGSGGGSIARIDTGGALRVGPESAGADPGPVAYGRGDQLTVTDANILLGFLPKNVRLAGAMPLDAERVDRYFRLLSSLLDLSPNAAAYGIIEVVNAQMSRAIRDISVERGHNPADYTLVAYGGAGGLHACALAEATGIRRVLIPRYPGAFSALGLALADVRREYAQSILLPADSSNTNTIVHILSRMRVRAQAEMNDEGIQGQFQSQAFVEARYKGQSYGLKVPFNNRVRSVVTAFHRCHRSRYGYADPGQPVELVTVGLSVSGSLGKVEVGVTLQTAHGEPQEQVSVITNGSKIDVNLFLREQLGLGQMLEGPALIIQDDSSSWIPGRWTGLVDAGANLVVMPS
jgi:N-methylhydantoinase A